MYYLVKRTLSKDAASGSISGREAFRAGLLHITGGVCAIALLAVGVYSVSHYYPHTRETFRRFADAVFSIEDEPKSARVIVPRQAPVAEPAANSAKPKRRAAIHRQPVPARQFVLPALPPVPAPELVDDGPTILAVAAFPVRLPEADVALPPRPGNPVLKVLAVLAHPFKFLGNLFNRRHDPPRHVTYEEFEPVE